MLSLIVLSSLALSLTSGSPLALLGNTQKLSNGVAKSDGVAPSLKAQFSVPSVSFADLITFSDATTNLFLSSFSGKTALVNPFRILAINC